MSIIIYNLLSYAVILLIYLISIVGIGRSINNLFIKSILFEQYQNLNLFLGLIICGFTGIILNIFSPFNEYHIIFYLIIGIVLYFYNLNFKDYKRIKSELKFVLSIILLSLIFSFYAKINDDFSYHIEFIKLFKSLKLNEILHSRTMSYNSHWLFLKSFFYSKNFPVSLYAITSLVYSIMVYDFYKVYRNKISKKEFFEASFFFLSLVFFIGVLNTYKDYGTDFIGAIISIYILIIYGTNFDNNKKNLEYKVFIIIIMLANFALMIKISNALIYIFVCIYFLSFQNKLKLIFLSTLVSVPLFLWILQNYSISSCIIWPISFLCFDNYQDSIREFYLIESFAKGDINSIIDVSGFSWVYTWISNHLKKLIEVYLPYTLIMTIPFIYFKFKLKIKFFDSIFIFYKNYNYKYLKFYLIPILLCNILWFLIAPAYRFGVFYNLNFFIFLIIPLWEKMFNTSLKLTIKSIKILFFVAILFFIYDAKDRYSEYIEKYNSQIWPPIINGRPIKP